MQARILSSLVVGLIVVAVAAQVAAAGGERKNERPFTRVVQTRTVQSSTHSTVAPTRLAAEPKNEAPFTQQAGATQTGSVGSGEPKNELPFTRNATGVVASAGSGSGFSWIAAALGLLAGISLTLAAVGGAMVARHRVPRPA